MSRRRSKGQTKQPVARPTGVVPIQGKEARRRKVDIVGFTPSREDARYDDDSVEIWGMNALFKVDGVPRATRWFDLHPVDKISEDRMKWYAEATIPIYLQHAVAGVPRSLEFPRESILQWCAEKGYQTEQLTAVKGYFTNSIAWMIALAMFEGMTDIGVYGVDMSTPDEYRTQRPNVEFWLGLAIGAGITVRVARTSDLLKATHEYGYGDDGGFRLKCKERIGDFTKRIKQAEAAIMKHGTEIRRLELVKATLTGACQDATWAIQSWGVYEGGSEEGRSYKKPGPDAPAKTVPEGSAAPQALPAAADEGEALSADVRDLTGEPETEPIDTEPEAEVEAEAAEATIPDEDEVTEFDDLGMSKGAAVG